MSFSGPSASVPIKTLKYTLAAGSVGPIPNGQFGILTALPVYVGPTDLDPNQGTLIFYPLGGRFKIKAFANNQNSFSAFLSLRDASQILPPGPNAGYGFDAKSVRGQSITSPIATVYASSTQSMDDFVVYTSNLPLYLQFIFENVGGAGDDTYSWKSITGYLLVIAQ